MATPAFSIHTSRSGRPDTNVVNLTGSVSSAGLQSFVPASATTLTPSTEYFVVFSNSGGDKIPLEGTISEDEDLGAAVGWSIANNYLRTIGSSWRSYVRSMEIAIKGMVVQTTTNAAPTASNGTVTTNEDTDYTFAAANFNFADTDSGAALSSVKIVTLPATGRGKLKLDGSAIALADLPQTVTTPDLDAGRLTYTPPANANGSGYASFTFKVNDGADDSASAYTLTIDVTASTEPATGAFISNTGQTKVATDYRVNRINSHYAQQFTTGTNPGGYTLSEVVVSIWRGGVATPAFSIHTSSDTNLPDTNVVNLTGSVSSAGLQSFVPASVTTLTPSTKYFVVFSRGQDQHSSGSYFLLEATASNNHDLGAAAGWSIANSFLRLQNGTWGSHGRSMKIAIKGTVQTTSTTNAAPTASNRTVTTNEDTDYTFAAANFNFADTDSGDALSSVKIVTLPAAGKGTLKLDGSAIALAELPQTVTTPDIGAGRLTYTPPANANGSGYASFTFKVNDGTDDSASAYTLTLDVTALNDPATGTPGITGTATVGQTLTAATSAIMDADGLTGPTYAYQWIRVATDSTETDISGATSSTYTLVAEDEGKTIKVKVSFSDDAGNPETLTSAATARVAAAGAANAVPTASDRTVTTHEDTDYTFAAANFNFADTDSGAALSSVKIVTLPAPGKGTLKLSGTNVTRRTPR